MEMLLFDAQTSGGLLVALPADRADNFIGKLNERGITDAGIVGEIEKYNTTRIIIRS